MAKILILDGGLGTTLEQDHGVSFDPTTPLWSSHLLVSDQKTLLRCQEGFGNVPVDIILTATYQVSIEGFEKTKTAAFPDGIGGSLVPRFLESAVDVAQRAKQGDAKVALSIGPYGACMVPSQEYSGKYDDAHDNTDALHDWHVERMQLFAGIKHLKQRISYIAIETIPRLDEILAIRRALGLVSELSSDTPFWMSCLFPNDDENLPDGSPPERVIRTMLDPRLAKAVPWGVGINCTKVWKLDSLLRLYEAEIRNMLGEGVIRVWPALVLYPDGTNGEVYNTTTKQWEFLDNNAKEGKISWELQLAQAVQDTMTRGGWSQVVVGGCCRSKPEDIKRLRDALAKD